MNQYGRLASSLKVGGLEQGSHYFTGPVGAGGDL